LDGFGPFCRPIVARALDLERGWLGSAIERRTAPPSPFDEAIEQPPLSENERDFERRRLWNGPLERRVQRAFGEEHETRAADVRAVEIERAVRVRERARDRLFLLKAWSLDRHAHAFDRRSLVRVDDASGPFPRAADARCYDLHSRRSRCGLPGLFRRRHRLSFSRSSSGENPHADRERADQEQEL